MLPNIGAITSFIAELVLSVLIELIIIVTSIDTPVATTVIGVIFYRPMLLLRLLPQILAHQVAVIVVRGG